jgi:hypothetical protein
LRPTRRPAEKKENTNTAFARPTEERESISISVEPQVARKEVSEKKPSYNDNDLDIPTFLRNRR